MATYQTPGVYVEEVSSGSKPIEGVGTGTGGFVGIAEKGPVGQAVLVTNWSQYTTTFGDHVSNWYMSYAVKNFFAEGGSKCYVVRTVHYTTISDKTSKKSTTATKAVDTDRLILDATSDGIWGNGLSVKIAAASDATIGDFNIEVISGGKVLEKFDNQKISTVNSINSTNIVFTGSGTASPTAGTYALTGGDNGLTGLVIADFSGDGSEKALNGLHAFDPIDEVNLIAMPDMHVISAATDNKDSQFGIQAGYAYCKNRGDCFFIAETPSGMTPSEAKTFRTGNLE